MPANEITDHAAFTQIDPDVDVFAGVDVSDTTMHASGTNKKITSNFAKYAGLAGIQGLELLYSSATAIIIKAGKVGVNGKQVAFSQTTYTSGSTMKNIANSTVTLGASACYWIFISDAGVIGIEINDGTGDGAVPVFDTAYDYWKAASTGLAWRRIGKFWTNASSQILKFTATKRGRTREMVLVDHDNIVVIAGVAGDGTMKAVTITPYLTADDDAMLVWQQGVAAVTGSQSMELSVDGGTNSMNRTAAYALSTGIVSAGGVWLPYTGTLHYSGNSSDVTVYIVLNGAEYFV